MKGGECITYLVDPYQCTHDDIKKKDCNDYFYLDNKSNKYKKCRKSTSNKKNCRNPLTDSQPKLDVLKGKTSLCKDQENADKIRAEFDKKQDEEYEEEQRFKKEMADQKKRINTVNNLNLALKNREYPPLNQESANKYIQEGKKDDEFEDI